MFWQNEIVKYGIVYSNKQRCIVNHSGQDGMIMSTTFKICQALLRFKYKKTMYFLFCREIINNLRAGVDYDKKSDMDDIGQCGNWSFRRCQRLWG